MTPPIEQATVSQSAALLSRESSTVSRASLRPLRATVVSLTDAWLIVAVLWISRFSTGSLRPAIALFGVATLALVVAPALRQQRLSTSSLDDAGPLFRNVWLAYALASVVTLWLSPEDSGLLLSTVLPVAPVLVAGRTISRALERSLQRAEDKSRTLVVGAGDIGRRLIATIGDHKEYGLDVVGAVDDEPKFSSDELGAELLGRFSDVPKLVRRWRINVVIVAFGAGDQANMIDVIRATMASGASVWVVPRFFELGLANGTEDHLWGLPVVRLQTPARSRPEWLLKRTLDFVIAAVGMIAAAPVMAVVALATLFDSGRPVFHRQKRVSLDGRSFDILKFRTMRVCDEAIQDVEWSAGDNRVTRVGAVLRKTGLDELPQLLNVLKGEMSLVGPRPERPHFVNLFRELYPRYDSRHRLPAGVTGWAQIHGLRGDTSIEERAAFDNYYIENWSLRGDLKILLRTVPTLFRGDGKLQRAKERREKRMDSRNTRGGKAVAAVLLVAMFLLLAALSSAAIAQEKYSGGEPDATVQSGTQRPGVLGGTDAGANTEDGGTLPFTGSDLTLFVATGLVAIGTGAVIVRRTRSSKEVPEHA